MRTLIQTYALAVCFASLLCLVTALGIGLYDLVQMSAPRFTLQHYDLYQSNDAFARSYVSEKDLPEEEMTRLREQALTEAVHGERRASLQSGVFVLIILAIDATVFAVHWRIANREQPASPA